MKDVPTQMARFSKLVESAGAPEPYTLWENPGQDSRFQRARREQRILTVFQNPAGSKRDYGIVGYFEDKQARYLLFPQKLNAFENKKVIGINYDLLATPKPVGPVGCATSSFRSASKVAEEVLG